MPDQVTLQDPHDKAARPAVAHDTMSDGAWQGPTYYRRSQLKAAPFGNWVVGGYIFCAGLAGASALISTIAGFGRMPQRRRNGPPRTLSGVAGPAECGAAGL